MRFHMTRVFLEPTSTLRTFQACRGRKPAFFLDRPGTCEGSTLALRRPGSYGSASAARVRSQEERGLITVPSARIGVMNNAIASNRQAAIVPTAQENGKEGLGTSKPRNLIFLTKCAHVTHVFIQNNETPCSLSNSLCIAEFQRGPNACPSIAATRARGKAHRCAAVAVAEQVKDPRRPSNLNCGWHRHKR